MLDFVFQHAHGVYSLYDIGQVIEELMGGAYQASFCRKSFRKLYATMKKVNYSNMTN